MTYPVFRAGFLVGLIKSEDDFERFVIARGDALRLKQRYLVFTNSVGTTALCCFTCGCVSYHPEDVRQKYCGNCRMFLADPNATAPFRGPSGQGEEIETLPLPLRETGKVIRKKK